MGQTLWAGSVEIHVLSSDWDRHSHSEDPVYNNVILHVVLFDDRPVLDKDGHAIPCLELHSIIAPHSVKSYLDLKYNDNHWIPCQGFLKSVDPHVIASALPGLLVERLERKTWSINKALIRTKNNLANIMPFSEI